MSQVQNGKAFEYAIAKAYFDFLQTRSVLVEWIQNDALTNACACFESFSSQEQSTFLEAAQQTIQTLLIVEPALYLPFKNEPLNIELASDAAGIDGDVRDIIFSRTQGRKNWEIGFSAKNNHEAVKHSRLSSTINFGEKWLGIPCSTTYMNTASDHFSALIESRGKPWNTLYETDSEKQRCLYVPILEAFKLELFRLYETHGSLVPQAMLKYLIGRKPFYKIIKDDRHNQVVVKAFNVENGLNKKTSNRVQPHKVQSIHLPEKIISLDFAPDSQTTLLLVLDKGWQISLRIHTASSRIETSLKFDINLIGNPPILFTQHLFSGTLSPQLPISQG